ncbi:uncharacterized protein LOC118232225 [Anguilla anguilla]|uniref:uncharacterized protein LOC118232225 n=1 Tax=Anguilla anguilla TaxID=7936 RepID=UPI0015A7E936|nr:uncharacterized protein LOC118232225 [Anguilla anguilla]
MKIVFQAGTEPVQLNGSPCTCSAGKVLCNHLVAMLFQSAHYSMMQMKAVPPTMACTSTLQTWHRPRTQGICTEPIQNLVVKKPEPSARSVCKSTLYQAYTGSVPGPSVLSLGERLKSLRPQPLISLVLHGLSELSLVDSRFGPVLQGSPLSYQCPPVVATSHVKHPDAPAFPKHPVDGAKFSTAIHFVPNCHQFFHLESLTVTQEIAAMIEEGTQEQSECPLWKEMRQPRVTASRFYEVFHERGGVYWSGTGSANT